MQRIMYAEKRNSVELRKAPTTLPSLWMPLRMYPMTRCHGPLAPQRLSTWRTTCLQSCKTRDIRVTDPKMNTRKDVDMRRFKKVKWSKTIGIRSWTLTGNTHIHTVGKGRNSKQPRRVSDWTGLSYVGHTLESCVALDNSLDCSETLFTLQGSWIMAI